MAFKGDLGDAETRSGRRVLIVITICLYLLLLLSTIGMSFTIYLFSRWSDSTMGASEVLILVTSSLSLCYVLLHSLAARRQRKSEHQISHRDSLRSSCCVLVRFLVALWLIALAAGLIVAVRQPTCLSSALNGPFWQTGLSCILHRITVAASAIGFVTSCTMFIALEMSDRPFDSSLFGISFPPVPAISKQVLFRSPSVDSSEIYDPSYTDLEKGLNIRNITNMMPGDRWLAYATPTLPSLTPRSPSWGSAWMSVIHRPNIYGTTSLQTAPPSPAVSDLSRHSSPGAMRRPSTTSTVSPLSSRMPSTLRRSPLSTMRRASNPEVPVLPEFVKRRSRMPLPEGWTLPAQLVIGQMSELAKGRQASSTLVPLPALVVTKNRTSKSPQIPDLDNGESFSAILSESIRAGGKGQIALDDSKASVVEIDSSSEIGRLDVGGGETRKGKATAGRRLEQQQQQLQSGGIPGGQSGRR